MSDRQRITSQAARDEAPAGIDPLSLAAEVAARAPRDEEAPLLEEQRELLFYGW